MMWAWPRPRVRDYLVHHQDITFDEYTDAFSLSFDVNWPYEDRLVIITEESPELTTKRYKINPVFEEHIRNMRHWTVGPRYWQHYPALGKAVEEDIREFGVVSRKPGVELNGIRLNTQPFRGSPCCD